MAIRKKQKPTIKDLVYNIVKNKEQIFTLYEKVMTLEGTLHAYMEMKKDTDKFKKYLQKEIKNAEAKEKDK